MSESKDELRDRMYSGKGSRANPLTESLQLVVDSHESHHLRPDQTQFGFGRASRISCLQMRFSDAMVEGNMVTSSSVTQSDWVWFELPAVENVIE